MGGQRVDWLDRRGRFSAFWSAALDFRPRSRLLSRSKDGRPNLFAFRGLADEHTWDPDRRRAAPRRTWLQTGAEPGMELVLQLRDLFLDYLRARCLLHHVRPGVQ